MTLDPHWLQYVVVFFGMVLTDFIWGRYTTNIARGNPVFASFWAMGIIMFGSFVVKSYVEDYTNVIPASLGAFVGTYISMKYESWLKK